MANKRQPKVEPIQKIEKKEKAPEAPILSNSDFNTIKFTDSQLKFFRSISDNFLTVCTGPAGTAKTFVACYAALDLIKKGEQKRIILARPAVESGENLGFLPGSVDEKIAPYMEGYTSNMEKILKSKEKIKLMIDKKIIDMQPLAFMRSRTFDDSILILDEAQNADLRQIMLVVTRMGQNSKIIICGDTSQIDLRNRKDSGLDFMNTLAARIGGVNVIQLKKNHRHPIVPEILDVYKEYLS